MRFLPLFSALFLLAHVALAEELNEALAKAYKLNPDLAAARAELRGVDELAPQARSGYRPTVSAAATAGSVNSDPDAGASDSYTPTTLALTLDQPLFRGGRTMAAVRQADSLIAAQRAGLQGTEQEVLLRGVQAYLSVLRDQSVLDLNENNEAVLKRQLTATRDRFKVGDVTRTDVSQAEARLSAAKSGRITAQGNLAQSRAGYQRLFGDSPSDLKKPDVTLALPATLEETQQAAAKANPAVVAALNNVTAADAQLSGVKGERLPTLDLQGRLARSDEATGSAAGEVDTTSAVVSLNWPLYQAGATSSRIRQSKQQVLQRQSLRESADRGAQEAATQEWQQWETAKASVESRQSQVKAAEVALNGVREEAKVGARTVLDTLDAEQEMLDARVGLVQAEHAELLARYQVLAAVGRLTARELKLPVEYYDEAAYSDRVRHKWLGSEIE